MRSATKPLREKFNQNKLSSVVRNPNGLSEEVEKNIIEWTTLFRRNWDIYAELVLGIKLKPFQREAIHLIGVSDVFFWRASRGTSKSFITAIAAIIKMMLYPNSWVVVTASTIEQANKIVEDKIIAEVIVKLSPYLLYYYENDYLLITRPNDGYIIKNTLNGSTLKVLAPIESSKGSRSTFTIYDEVAIMKKKAIDDIFDGMLFPRQAMYLNNVEYSKNKRWVEDAKAIYLTSSKYQFEWWYKTWCDCVTGYYVDKKTKYNVCASDFFTSIDANLKTWGDYRRAKRVSSEYDFRMNYLNEAIGEANDAFFSLESFKKNQILKKSFVPATPLDIVLGNELHNPKKNTREVRLIVADFAWTETNNNVNESDKSIVICMSGHWKKDTFEKHIDYIEQLPTADDVDGCSERLQELYWLYEADYMVIDARSGGEGVMNALSKPYSKSVYKNIVLPRGLTIADKADYQVASNEKLEYYRYKAIDKKAIPCIIPILGTANINTAYWRATRRALESNKIKFLISMSDKQTEIEDDGSYYKMTAEKIAETLAPYGETDLLIGEAVNLKTEIRNEQIKLIAPRTGHKDRIVTLAMGMLIFDHIENEWNRQGQEVEIDVDDIQLVW